MSLGPTAVPGAKKRSVAPSTGTLNRTAPVSNFHIPAYPFGQSQDTEPSQRQAELFYMQKQIQTQTPMVLVLEDGEQVEGCIEWYDRNVLKIRGRSKTLVYKAAVKYMYKQSEAGQGNGRD